MGFETLLLEIGEVSVLTVNRPDKLNALNAQVIGELEKALDAVDAAGDVRVLLITGSGPKAFVAGADISELAKVDARGGEATATRGQALLARLESARYATVAVVNGFALGGGLELAMACDIRVASKNAKLGLPEVTLGIIPGYAGTQRLPRLVGKGKALELVMTGEMIPADEALRIGLVNQVHEAADLMGKARELAGKIVKAGPLATRYAKKLVHDGQDVPLPQACRAEAQAFAILCTTEDKAEGTKAFLEKRPAKFVGR